jgi:hypothetical protein
VERSFPQFTRCAAPGSAYSMSETGGWLGLTLLSIIFGGAAGGVWAFVSYIITQAVSWGCVAGIGLLALAISGVHGFKYWYYNERLMCIDKDQCVVGTMTGEATVSTDGDRKFDVLVAPFPTEEVQVYFAELIQANPAEFGPGPVNFSDVIALQNYIESMSEASRVRLYIRVVRERLFNQPGRDYQERFLVRDLAQMGAAAFNASDDDTLAAPDPNPMFRIAPADSLAPYMHNELEGNRVERWLDNVLVGLWTFLVSYTALCAVCEFVTGGADWFCGWVAAALSAVLAFLAWLISHLVNDPDDGVAGQTDVDIDDPAYDGDKSTIVPGDVLALSGDWIMDTEHGQYFELHPIKAIYLVCQSEGNPNQWEVIHDLSNYPRQERCPFPVEEISQDDWQRICAEIMDEGERAPVEVERSLSTHDALSVAAGIR